MVGKTSSKRSALYSKGTNATLDQFFIVKNKSTENSTTTGTTNENNSKNIASSADISKQQQNKKLSSPLSPLPSNSLSDKSETGLTKNKQHRRPLAEIGGKSAHALSMMTTTKPAKPSFTVLRDDDIEQNATETDVQQQTRTPAGRSPLSSLPPPDETGTQQQPTDKHNLTSQQQQSSALKDDDDVTQDSQTSSFGEYNKGTPESFFGDDSDDDSVTEFRVDTLDTDTDDDGDDNDDNHGTSSSFFDDDDEPPFLTKTHRRTHLPTVITPSIPSKRPSETKDDDKETDNSNNKMVKSSHRSDTNLSPTSTNSEESDGQGTNDDSLLEFPISNSLTIPLNIKDNYHSSLDDADDDGNDSDSPSPPSSAATESDVASSTSQQRPPESPTPQLQRSPSSSATDMPTLPMSLPTDETLDLHVAYPVPRGKQVIDKFSR